MSKNMIGVMLFILASLVAAAVYAAGSTPETSGCSSVSPSGNMDVHRIEQMQERLSGLPVGDRIAAWADYFVGTPYDTIPIGLYVDTRKIVCDSEVDCMYLVFRAAELGTSGTPEEAQKRALDLRFKTKGVLDDEGRVSNYDDRFQYGEDMIASGKWGDEVTSEIGTTETIPGARGRDEIAILPKDELLDAGNLAKFRDGDIIFFIKDPSRRVVGEIVGHLGIIKVEDGVPMLIHASGTKESAKSPGGGVVKKVPLMDYARDMKFIGVQVTRFGDK